MEKDLTSSPLDLWNAMNNEIVNGDLKVVKPTLRRLNDPKLSEISHGLLSIIITHDQFIEAFKSIADTYGTVTRTLVSAAQMLSKRLKQIVNLGNENVQNSNCKLTTIFTFLVAIPWKVLSAVVIKISN